MKFNFSKSSKKEFAAKMQEIKEFCDRNEIQYSKDMNSFYFEIDSKQVRVSNHTIKASDKGCFYENIYTGENTKIRDSYHENKKYDIQITASKTRIIEIYNDLKAGIKLNKRGNRI